jgi:hypothetical protein
MIVRLSLTLLQFTAAMVPALLLGAACLTGAI